MSSYTVRTVASSLFAVATVVLSYRSVPEFQTWPHVFAAEKPAPADVGWKAYNGDKGNSHYSPLSQINAANVSQLTLAWRFDAGDGGGLQTNPLVIGNTLYGYTTKLHVVALNAATGKLLWSFRPDPEGSQPSRGFTWWSEGSRKRLFAYAMNYVYALDPASGAPITSFGENGRIDLRQDLGKDDHTSLSVVATTPGIIYHNLLIVGFRTSESKPAARGDIRAYDVLTGRLVWSFHTIPHSGEPGYDTWPAGSWDHAGGANNWCGMALDEARGIVYVPTGSAASDFYGGDRVGSDLYANTLLALDAATGKMLWHFQGVHHDIWDRDFPSPPTLLTVTRSGRQIDAIAQPSKQGFLFVLDRVTGKSIFPIEEIAVPPSTVPGEVTSPTQPIARLPQPFARQELTESMLTTRTTQAHDQALRQFHTFAGGKLFVPFSVGGGTIIFPGFDGGAEWGGSAVSPSGVLFLNANDVPWTGELAKKQKGASPGRQTYQSQCAACHGRERQGSPPVFPSLIGISNRMSDSALRERINNGSGRMPSFPDLKGERLDQLVSFLKETSEATEISGPQRELISKTTDESDFYFTGYHKFQDSEGYPAVLPPWGTLNAIDLNSGRYLWKVPLGQYPALATQGMSETGSENYGGPIVTAGGLTFIGATIYDRKLRAFDSGSGRLLWSTDLPFAGVATPATYMVEGKQYIVIATSGSRDQNGPQGAAYVAYKLP